MGDFASGDTICVDDKSMVFVTDQVAKVFEHTYGLTKVQLYPILEAPPLTTVLRINTTIVDIERAEEILLDFLKLQSVGESFAIKKHPHHHNILTVSSLGSSSIVTCLNKEIIVDTVCGAAVLRGADVFAPGVLGATTNMKSGDMVSVYADTSKLCRRGCILPVKSSKIHLGNGVACCSRSELFSKNNHQCGVAIKMTQRIYPLPSFTHLDRQLFFPQNFPSIAAGNSLPLDPDAIVLDMCSSPGGKASHIASRLNNKGMVICIDKTRSKISKVDENAKVQMLRNIKTFVFDCTLLCSENSETFSVDQMVLRGPPFPRESFKYILLDPPCSGLGQRPQLRCDMTDMELQSYPSYQRKMLAQAFLLLKTNGYLLYSTCTIRPQENEEQVAWALKTFPELELVQQEPSMGLPGLLGYGLDRINCEKVQRFDYRFRYGRQIAPASSSRPNFSAQELSAEDDPCKLDTIGFFFAVFLKR